MNFVDFFIFISWFSFANLTLLNHLVTNDEYPIGTLSDQAHHLIHNLASIRRVAFNMKSAEVFAGEKLEGCLEAFSDIREIFEKPEFIELCIALSRTYGMIGEQRKPYSITKSTSIGVKPDFLCSDFIEAVGSKVCGPEDLIRIMDYAITKFSCGNNSKDFNLLSVMNELDSSTVL